MKRAMQILSVLLLILRPAAASEGPPPILDIKTYSSPSGEYALTVDPSHLHGQGKGSYKMAHAGKEVWSKDLDYTLWDACVTDSGEVAGYAYTNGWRGFAPKIEERGYGDFIIAILDPAGMARQLKSVPRTEGGLHTAPNPLAQGCFADTAHDRFIVRFRNEGRDIRDTGERWEAYSLSTGDALPDLKLAPPSDSDSVFSLLAAARPVGELILTTWWRDKGLRLSLVDKDCREVWHQDFAAEFNKIENFSYWWDVQPDELTPRDGLKPNQFAFRSIREQARITFAATRAGDGSWKIDETGRNPEPVALKHTRRKEQKLEAPPVTLRELGRIDLATPGGADEPSLDVMDFEFDSAGRIGFIAGSDPLRLILMDPAGGPTRSVDLGMKFEDHLAFPQAAWIGGDKWVVLRANYDQKLKTKGFTVDTAAGTVTPMEGFACPAPAMQRGLIGAGPRGFIVMGDYASPYIMAFSPEGKRLWTADSPGTAKAVTACPEGRVGVLTGIDDHIVVFDDKGQTTQNITLVQSMGLKPNYVAGLSWDANGGWILHDFGGHPPVYRLDGEGKVKSRFEPQYLNGQAFTLYGDVQAAPNGRMWTSDRAALLRLDDAGKVDQILGRKPDAESIAELRPFSVDHAGNLYAGDARNGWVHVFDSTGKRQRTLKPDAHDAPANGGAESIAIAGDGSVYCRMRATNIMEHDHFLKFDRDGKRIGFEPGVSGEVVDEWLFRPGTQERLVLGYERAFLVNAAGEKTRTIERRADRRWLDKPHTAAFAPDGSFAIIATPSSWGAGGGPSLTIFTPAGDPTRTLDLPGTTYPRIAFNGTIACVVDDQTVLFMNAATGKIGSFSMPGGKKRWWWYPYTSPDGKELWMLDPEAKSLHRFAMPEV